jgi:hypothetical protein
MFDVKEAEMAVGGIHNPVPWQVHLSGRLRDIWQLGRKVQQVQDGAGAFGGRGNGNGRTTPRQLLFMS